MLGSVTLILTSSSSVVSCFDTTPKVYTTFKDAFIIFDLGTISGQEDVPSLEIIYNGISKAHENVEDWGWSAPLKHIAFVGLPTKTSCKIRVIEGHDKPALTGEVEFTYNYEKIQEYKIDFYSITENANITRRIGTIEEISKFSNLVTNWR
ncbi:hypothetical protein STAIW_v1c06990 [Spiroplasma taiwanense CT-1]|uniref:Uncharacterized protein n=1 Tax=Spiroplasma taiwanense CT-1 TaxID=1276220 RepID=S5MHI8_9MOLU|nr:hypothetical protein [Spiroplasma taiwanense]AGR41315.1 hypothetical protein STAIW_v1c06990 [Spiroplasma taiwanense CT-1]